MRDSTQAGERDAAPAETYEVYRAGLLQQRLRLLTGWSVLPILFATIVNLWSFWDDHLREHVSSVLLQGVICGVIWLATGRPFARRHPERLALSLMLAVATVLFWSIRLATAHPESMLAVVVGVMMLVTLGFPWGVFHQAIFSSYITAGYLASIAWPALTLTQQTNVLIGMTFGIGPSIAGTALLDRQRRETYLERARVEELARQREILLDVSRELNSTTDFDALVTLIARLGQRLVGCSFATITLHDERHPERVVSVGDGDEEPLRSNRRVVETEAHLRTIQQLGTVEIPGYPEFDFVVPLARRFGIYWLLAVAVVRDDRLLAMLTFASARSEAGFSEHQRRLAEGIAHQAAIALANAKLVQDLQEANRVKTEFVSTMSHELRTPLNVILGYSEMGRDPDTPSAERSELLCRIDLAARDLLELIEGTLALGKLETGRDAAELASQELALLWAEIGNSCSRLPRKPGVDLEWSSDAPPTTILTDRAKLTIILRNLVGNALKFTTAGWVRASVRVDDDDLVLTVRDTGIGIGPEDQLRIFEMYRQADGSDSRRFGGSGLGLYIVRRYAQLLGGDVSVESTPGLGAAFTVRLPRDASKRPASLAA